MKLSVLSACSSGFFSAIVAPITTDDRLPRAGGLRCMPTRELLSPAQRAQFLSLPALVGALIEEMRDRQIIIPGITTVERLGWEVRCRAQRQVFRLLTEGLTNLQRMQLQVLLTVPATSRQTLLVWLRQPPGAASPANFLKVVERLRWIRELGLDPQVTSRVHQNRLHQLAREGARMTAQRLGEFDVARRDATLVAFLLATAEDLVDQALDMHDKLLGQQFKKGERKQEDQIKKSRKAINEKVRLYARVGKALITAKAETQDAYQAIETIITWEHFVGTVEEAEQLSTTTTEVDTVEILVSRYPQPHLSQEHYSDTWGYTDQVFGMAHLLGFRFAPRIRDLGDKRLYSFEKPAAYPGLESFLGGTINVKQMETHWDDLLRLTSSL